MNEEPGPGVCQNNHEGYYSFYSTEMDKKNGLSSMEKELRGALERRELTVFFISRKSISVMEK